MRSVKRQVMHITWNTVYGQCTHDVDVSLYSKVSDAIEGSIGDQTYWDLLLQVRRYNEST